MSNYIKTEYTNGKSAYVFNKPIKKKYRILFDDYYNVLYLQYFNVLWRNVRTTPEIIVNEANLDIIKYRLRLKPYFYVRKDKINVLLKLIEDYPDITVYIKEQKARKKQILQEMKNILKETKNKRIIIIKGA